MSPATKKHRKKYATEQPKGSISKRTGNKVLFWAARVAALGHESCTGVPFKGLGGWCKVGSGLMLYIHTYIYICMYKN